MPQQIFIQPEDRYNIEDYTYWKIQIGNKIYRDIPIFPNKITKVMLIELLKHAGLTRISNCNKGELLQMYQQWYIFI